jgi:co-chaperonin GroES (HSP10)
VAKHQASNVQIKPVAGRILLQVIAAAREEDQGGIIVVNKSAEERRGGFREAIVREFPNGYHGDLYAGQRVLIPPYAGREVCYGGDTLVFAKESEIEAAVDA